MATEKAGMLQGWRRTYEVAGDGKVRKSWLAGARCGSIREGKAGDRGHGRRSSSPSCELGAGSWV